MWIMTDMGYVSAVVHRDDNRKLVVRARDRRSLEQCLRSANMNTDVIYSDFPSDYPFRAVMTRRQFKTFLKVEVNTMWYSNFKNAATKTSGKLYHDFLMRVWIASHVLTPADAKRDNDRAWSKLSKKWSGGKHGSAGFESRYGGGTAHYTNGVSAWGPVESDLTSVMVNDEFDSEAFEMLDDDIDHQIAIEDEETAMFLAGKSHHDMTEDEWIASQDN